MVATALAPPARAFLEFNDGRDRITATAAYGITYDSNLDARAGGPGDYSQSLTVGADYVRRAGLIGVDASIGVATGRFHRYGDQDYTNPTAKLELNKSKGRLTGSVALSAQRESRSDVSANIRTNSWYYDAALNARYPINDRYYFTSTSEYNRRDYLRTAALYNLSSVSEALDVFYRYSSKLDLQGGYRFRYGDAENGSTTQDNAATFGVTGSLLPKLNGSVRVGYQWRREAGAQPGRFSAVTSALALTWPATKRLVFTSAVSKDFMTTATDISVDATAFSLGASLTPAPRLNLTAGVGYTSSRYLGPQGGGRVDRAPSGNAALSFAFTSVISSSISYAYTDNQSNVALSDFSRHTVAFTLSARY